MRPLAPGSGPHDKRETLKAKPEKQKGPPTEVACLSAGTRGEFGRSNTVVRDKADDQSHNCQFHWAHCP